jgi:hypothetical protein
MVVQESEYKKCRGNNNGRKDSNVLRIPRWTMEATQVPHDHGAENSLHQKRAA